VSVSLRAFAEYRWAEFHGEAEAGAEAGAAAYRDNARLNLRTAVMADRLMAACDGLKARSAGRFALDDIELPLAAGCIGRGPAVQYLAIRRARAAVHDIDAILVYFSQTENTGENIDRLFYYPVGLPGGAKERCPLSAGVCVPSRGEGAARIYG